MPFLLLSGTQGQPFSSSGIFTDSICYSLLFYVGIKQVGETIRATVSWLTVTTLLAWSLHYAPCMCLPRYNEGVLTRRRQRQAPGPGAASNRAARPVLGPVYTRDAWHDVWRDTWRATLVTVTVNKSLVTSRHIITPRVPQVGTAALSRGCKHSLQAESFSFSRPQSPCKLFTFSSI